MTPWLPVLSLRKNLPGPRRRSNLVPALPGVFFIFSWLQFRLCDPGSQARAEMILSMTRVSLRRQRCQRGLQILRHTDVLPPGYGGQEEEVFTLRGVPSERSPGLASSPSAFTAVMR